jgi:hypothetical protein
MTVSQFLSAVAALSGPMRDKRMPRRLTQAA